MCTTGGFLLNQWFKCDISMRSIIAASLLIIFKCVIIAPFGLPVVPDV
jgi:hypothetical protein